MNGETFRTSELDKIRQMYMTDIAKRPADEVQDSGKDYESAAKPVNKGGQTEAEAEMPEFLHTVAKRTMPDPKVKIELT